MGSVFSTYASTQFMAELVLRLGAATIGAFGAYARDYIFLVQIMFYYCEPAEDEPFEDFTELLQDLCSESASTVHSDIFVHQPLAPAVSSLDSYSATGIETKKLYLAVLDQAMSTAKRFRRRFDSYGPPEWCDPGIDLLPPMNIFGAWDFNVIPSMFPFAAPHILISPSFPNDSYVTWSNGLHHQDHDWGNRLIVYSSPSVSGPHPLVINAADAYPFSPCPVTPPFGGSSDTRIFDNAMLDIPALYSDNDDISSCSETEESNGVMDDAEHSKTLGKLARQPPTSSQFWIPEDEEDLPTLPDHWY